MFEPDMWISPKYKAQHWQDLEFRSEDDWEKAVRIFDDRIKGRFLTFVDKVARYDFSGFVVLAIDCLLIETLMQFQEGVRETPPRKHQEYFVTCLTGKHFGLSNKQAETFYKHFRNGILHQAEIKGTSKTKRGDYPLVSDTTDGNGLIINRDLFHGCLLLLYDDYKAKLADPSQIELRKKFRIKMDIICRKKLVV
jgi:hypothetical protein